MSMSNAWTERLFTRMLARYGSAWINMWAGVDAQAMHDDWGQVLDGMPSHMIVYGLDNLPERPPNATQFRAICVQHPARRAPELPAPPANPARVEAALTSMFAMQRQTAGDMKDWARRLRDRELNHGGELESGRKLTKTQRDMWRQALEPHGPAQIGPGSTIEAKLSPDRHRP